MKALVALEAVVRLGSINAAAQELGVTHGAVSKQITSLEEWFGRSLFDHERHRFRAYDETRLLAELMSKTLDDLFGLVHQITGEQTALRVIMQATFALRWVIPRLDDFYKLHPDLEVHVKTRQTNDDWRAGQFDVAVIRGDETIKDWVGTEIAQEQLTLMAVPDMAEEMSVDKAALRKRTLLCSDSRTGELDHWLKAAELAEECAGNRRQCFDHFYAALQAAINGMGVIVGPLPILDYEISKGNLRAPFPDITITGPKHVAFYNPSGSNRINAKKFIHWLKIAVNTP